MGPTMAEVRVGVRLAVHRRGSDPQIDRTGVDDRLGYLASGRAPSLPRQ